MHKFLDIIINPRKFFKSIEKKSITGEDIFIVIVFGILISYHNILENEIDEYIKTSIISTIIFIIIFYFLLNWMLKLIGKFFKNKTSFSQIRKIVAISYLPVGAFYVVAIVAYLIGYYPESAVASILTLLEVIAIIGSFAIAIIGLSVYGKITKVKSFFQLIISTIISIVIFLLLNILLFASIISYSFL